MTAHTATTAEDQLVRRVRKLLDKAERTSNPHEAEAFSAKAASLVARHRIDPQRLAAPLADGELGVRTVPLGRGAYVRARLALLIAIADAHDVRVVFHNGPTGMVATLAGFTDDLAVTEVLYTSLHQQAARQMSGSRRATAAATQRHRRSFLFGYASRIGQILAEAGEAARSEPGAGSRASVEVAVRQRVELVDEFAERTWGRVRTARRPRAAEAHGWDRGAQAADTADIGRSRLTGKQALPGGRAAS